MCPAYITNDGDPQVLWAPKPRFVIKCDSLLIGSLEQQLPGPFALFTASPPTLKLLTPNLCPFIPTLLIHVVWSLMCVPLRFALLTLSLLAFNAGSVSLSLSHPSPLTHLTPYPSLE